MPRGCRKWIVEAPASRWSIVHYVRHAILGGESDEEKGGPQEYRGEASENRRKQRPFTLSLVGSTFLLVQVVIWNHPVYR